LAASLALWPFQLYRVAALSQAAFYGMALWAGAGNPGMGREVFSLCFLLLPGQSGIFAGLFEMHTWRPCGPVGATSPQCAEPGLDGSMPILRKTFLGLRLDGGCLGAGLRNAQSPTSNFLTPASLPIRVGWISDADGGCFPIGCRGGGRRGGPEGPAEHYFWHRRRRRQPADNHFVQHRFVGDCCSLPFADSSFDLLTANMVVEHVAHPRALLSEVRRILKPNGIFLFHHRRAELCHFDGAHGSEALKSG